MEVQHGGKDYTEKCGLNKNMGSSLVGALKSQELLLE